MKKPKNIHLTEGAIKALSILAIENGTNFKNYVESLLEASAVEKKKKKKKCGIATGHRRCVGTAADLPNNLPGQDSSKQIN